MKQDQQTLTVALGSRSYTIAIGSGLLETLGTTLQPLLPGRQVAIVSNSTVAPLYLDRVEKNLQDSGFTTLPIILPDGEIYKDWTHLQTIFDQLIAARYERKATLLALGGGVVGDMTGYAAASFLRGVNYVQVPTTLLAQVDSSVGGKTGINHPLGKNLIGAFYQPKLVLIDTDTLATLPERQQRAGLAEVIKYGLLWDSDFFAYLEAQRPAILRLEQEPLNQLIQRSCAIKAAIVGNDEREAEQGQRALLNLGHTFGHAIETLTGYEQLLHGEAVAIGMVMAAELSEQLQLCPVGTVARTRQLLLAYGLPVSAPAFPVEHYLEAMARDKKVQDGTLRLVILTRIGSAELRGGLPMEAIRQAIVCHLQPQD
ncbi:MAG: 3-dehydroquinate synthase [Magnetococcales bacterium]|nr:3-dehydroquinate synthase [Magnetococcales bacterium]